MLVRLHCPYFNQAIPQQDGGRQPSGGVRTDAPGLPIKECEPIFEGSHGLDLTEEGTGLGLTMARGQAELHGGQIWMDGERSHSSTFRVARPHREN